MRRKVWAALVIGAAVSLSLVPATVTNFLARSAAQEAPVPAPEPTVEGPAVEVTAGPRWGPSLPGAWTPYVVTVTNNGGTDLSGDVVLTPNPAPPDGSGAPRTTPTEPHVVVLGGIDASRARVWENFPGAAAPLAPAWPTVRSHVTVAGSGGRKQLTMLVVESQYGHRVELQDSSGRVVASPKVVAPELGSAEAAAALTAAEMPSAAGVARTEWAVAALTRADTDAIRRGTSNHLFGSQMNVSRIETASDVPGDLLSLAGVQAVLIADFDSAALDAAQIRALKSFVGLGGSLLLGGGPAAAQTVASLPDDLVPLRPTGVAEVPLAPLADMAGRTTAATASVATGELRHGAPVIQAPGSPPLVVQSAFGTGRVVQLTYDPFTEPFASDEFLAGLGLEQGLARALDPLGFGGGPGSGGDEDPEAIWLPLLDRSAAEAAAESSPWPSWSPVLAVGYALALGPVTYLVLRGRRRRPLVWPAIPLTALLLAALGATTGIFEAGASAGTDIYNSVHVKTLGADGTMLVAGYHGLPNVHETRPSDAKPTPGAGPVDLTGPASTLSLPPGVAASSVVAQPTVPRNDRTSSLSAFSWAFGQPVPGYAVYKPDVPLAPTREEVAEILVDGTLGPIVTLPGARPNRVRTVQTLSVEQRPGAISADLHVVRPPDDGPYRLKGTVTNDTGGRLRSVVARVSGGERAIVAPDLDHGATVVVDAPLTRFSPGSLARDNRDEIAAFTAAGSAGVRTGQVALVGLEEPGPDSIVGRPFGARLDVVVQVVPFVDLSDSRLVSTSFDTTTRKWVTVFEYTAPSALNPVSFTTTGSLLFEVYDWSSGAWRPGNPAIWPAPEVADRSIKPGSTLLSDRETERGLVRVRTVEGEPRSEPSSGGLKLGG